MNMAVQLSPALDRIPPQALEAEQATLGCCMGLGGKAALAKAREALRPGDWYRNGHRLTWEAICALDDRSEPHDVLLVAQELEMHGQLDAAGGRPYLLACLEAPMTVASVGSYAARVVESARYRQMIECGTWLTGAAYEQAEEAERVLDQAEAQLFNIRARDAGRGLIPIGEVLREVFEAADEAYQKGGHLVGAPSGFAALDRITGGFHAGELTLLAGRPSMGKSAIGIGFAQAFARETGRPVAVFSLEMTDKSIGARMIAGDAKINAMRLRDGRLQSDGEHGDEWTRMTASIGNLAPLPIWIDDTPGATMSEIRGRARRLKAQSGLGLIVVDYLQLIRTDGKHESRYQEVSWIGRQLKALARELDVSVIALSQLSRRVEQREKKRPMLSDLLESGTLEAEADLVLLLYREWYYREGLAPVPEPADLHVAKQRNGPTGDVRLDFIKTLGTFAQEEE